MIRNAVARLGAALLLAGLLFPLPHADAAPESIVTAEWLEDVPDLGRHTKFIASTAEYRAMVVFSARRKVDNFKILALSFRDIDKDGNAVFDIKELHTLKSLEPGCPLVVAMELIGSIPNNGISYTDSKGKTLRFTLSQSGEDGSAILAGF